MRHPWLLGQMSGQVVLCGLSGLHVRLGRWGGIWGAAREGFLLVVAGRAIDVRATDGVWRKCENEREAKGGEEA